MKTEIKKLKLFLENGEVTTLNFVEGLNIISGVSKTGKSAIIEIFDFCFASSRNTIPLGIISEKVKLYCIILKIKKKFLILARKKFSGDNRGKQFIRIENINFDIENITYKYFEDNNNDFYPLKVVREKLSEIFDIGIEKKITEEGEKTPGIRNILPFIFQHQNLIANKYSIFYKFDEYIRRKTIIEEYPIFMKIVDQDFYYLTTELKEITKKKELLDNELKNLEILKNSNIIKIREKIERYYEILNYENEEKIEITNEKEVIEKLPIYSYEDLLVPKYSDLILEYNEKIKRNSEELNEKNNELQFLKKVIRRTKEKNEILNSKLNDNEISIVSSIHCPFCDNEVQSLNNFSEKLKNAKEKIKEEIYIGENHDVPLLLLRKRELEKLINTLEDDKIFLERKRKEFIDSDERIKSVTDKEIELKLIKEEIKLLFNYVNGDTYDILIEKIKKYDEKIEEIKGILLEKGIDSKKRKLEKFIEETMNEIGENFDFENTFRPLNFKFNVDNFDVYLEKDNEKIFLSSMGSGANWLGFHLTLFLSLLKATAKHKRSSIPTILFLDQPSQVYFPSIYDLQNNSKNVDYEAMQKIYSAICEYLTTLKENNIDIPQIIIMDHIKEVDLSSLKLPENSFRVCWEQEGDGLIPKYNER